MDRLWDSVLLSRLQFSVTTMFHILWPLLSIGLSWFLVVTEAAWLKTGKEIYYRHTRFWAKLFLLSFGVGVASGLPLEFQFGTNWAKFSTIGGGFFGNILGFEGAMAFMLEAAFLGIMIFAWNKVSHRMHMFATVMVAFAATLSAFWIMCANAWMQTPTGVEMRDGQLVVVDYVSAVFNPALVYSFTHMWVACVVTSAFFVCGISAWYILRRRNAEFFLTSFKLGLALAIVAASLQVYLGDLSGRGVGKHQPAKLAAMEAHWETNPPGQGASWSPLAWPDQQQQRNAWEVQVPGVLSVLATHSLTGEVVGLKTFAREDQPPVLITFLAFRLMLAIGTLMLLLALWGLWKWVRKELRPEALAGARWFWRAWIWAIPLGFIATDAGWVVREVGRQPWVLQGILRTSEGVSNFPPGPIAFSLLMYTLIYMGLLTLFVVFARRIVLRGPDLARPAPEPFRPGTEEE